MTKLLMLVHMEDPFRHLIGDCRISKLASIMRKRERFDWHVHFSSHLETQLHFHELNCLIDEEYEWAWGYEHGMFSDEVEDSWIIDAGQSMHDLTWVPRELRGDQFRNFEIYLAGGVADQCLASMEAVLRYTKHEYTLLPEFIYHTDHDKHRPRQPLHPHRRHIPGPARAASW